MCEECEVVESELDSLYQEQPKDEVPEFDGTPSREAPTVAVR